MKIDIPFESIEFDIPALDKLIKSNGVQLVHMKAIKCPIGMVDPYDVRSPDHSHDNCSNGFIYKQAGLVTASFTNNAATVQLSDVGLLDGSTVQATFPRFYDDNPEKQVYVQIFDRFYIKDLAVLVPNTQHVAAHITKTDKLTYHAEQVEYIIDANGKEYVDTDYLVQNGKLTWTGNNWPGFDPSTGKGVTYSIRYLYTPYFYASRLIHEVRIAQKTDFKTNKKSPVRVPYAALLSREFYQYKTEKHDDGSGSDSSMAGPDSSIFGPK